MLIRTYLYGGNLLTSERRLIKMGALDVIGKGVEYGIGALGGVNYATLAPWLISMFGGYKIVSGWNRHRHALKKYGVSGKEAAALAKKALEERDPSAIMKFIKLLGLIRYVFDNKAMKFLFDAGIILVMTPNRVWKVVPLLTKTALQAPVDLAKESLGGSKKVIAGVTLPIRKAMHGIFDTLKIPIKVMGTVLDQTVVQFGRELAVQNHKGGSVAQSYKNIDDGMKKVYETLQSLIPAGKTLTPAYDTPDDVAKVGWTNIPQETLSRIMEGGERIVIAPFKTINKVRKNTWNAIKYLGFDKRPEDDLLPFKVIGNDAPASVFNNSKSTSKSKSTPSVDSGKPDNVVSMDDTKNKQETQVADVTPPAKPPASSDD